MECLSRDGHAHSGLDVKLVGDKAKELGGSVRDRRLRVATWNFSELGSEHKQKELGKYYLIMLLACLGRIHAMLVVRLISFLNEVELVVCNGRSLVLEPKWTRVRSTFL